MKIASALRRWLFAAVAAAATVPSGAVDLVYDWGRGEIQEDHALGPGMWYTKVIYPNKPVIVWLVEIDLTNPYAKVEQVQSRHQVPDDKRWDVMTHYRENSDEGHRVVAAWNHDFFSYGEGICIGLNVSEGEVTWHKWGRSLLGITDDGHASVFYPSLDSRLTAPDGTSVEIDFYNSTAYDVRGDCVLFNRLNARTLAEEGTYIALEPLDPWRVNGADIRCRVKEISDSPLQSTTDGTVCVALLRNGKRHALDGHLAVGDILNVRQSFRAEGWGERPANILNAFHGYPSIVHNGVLHEGEFNNFENGREYEKSSRVMAGISQDGTKMYIVTTEMSGASTGVDCIELSAWLVEHGAWDVVNFDSGGSAAIVIDGEMLNVPGRGSVRPVEDAALAVSLAPDDNNVDHMAFSMRAIDPVVMSRTPLRLIGFNTYGNIVEQNLQGCSFAVEPADIGYVDTEGVFHASHTQGEGTITARRDGMEAVLAVSTRPVANLSSTYSTLLIDAYPHPIAGITGEADGMTVDIDPASLDWTVTPAGIAAVENGIVRGIANGHATLNASFGELSFEIGVDVEIADPEITVFNCADHANLGLTASSTLKNLTYTTEGLPEHCAGGVALDFDLSAGRSSSIKIAPNTVLYSLPDELLFTLDDAGTLVNKVTFSLTDAQNKRLTYTSVPEAGQTVHAMSLREPENVDYWRYPLTLKNITLYIENTVRPQARIVLGSLTARYPGYSGMENIATAPAGGSLAVRVGAATLGAVVTADRAGSCTLSLCDMSGRTVALRRLSLEAGINTADIDISELPSGIYILSAGGAVNAARKVILR